METRFSSGNMIDSDTLVLRGLVLLVVVQALVVCVMARTHMSHTNQNMHGNTPTTDLGVYMLALPYPNESLNGVLC
jgi:hypothetical protein